MSTEKKADFSNVQGSVSSTEEIRKQADFSNVQSSVSSTEEITASTAGSEQSYTVEKGDTLSAIAKQFYGKSGAWRDIFEANRDQIDDPDRIFPGQVLKIPAINAGK
ncbi:LysM peptidoglycan-binding domain-containing protein [Aerolutibacter ruishenii]|uniref:Potassium binding protein Kbp n=1 Tax=Aerolutibacter ruishenii TaxID=686800 RepID=A0A562M0F5_9GAMM|nr:LysM peptidoglycan-binding domain-containing protein [Lysobacter ruishenii]TWI13399.1 LysM domain-containing protein [Lysobacter ruishenii]